MAHPKSPSRLEHITGVEGIDLAQILTFTPNKECDEPTKYMINIAGDLPANGEEPLKVWGAAIKTAQDLILKLMREEAAR